MAEENKNFQHLKKYKPTDEAKRLKLPMRVPGVASPVPLELVTDEVLDAFSSTYPYFEKEGERSDGPPLEQYIDLSKAKTRAPKPTDGAEDKNAVTATAVAAQSAKPGKTVSVKDEKKK